VLHPEHSHADRPNPSGSAPSRPSWVTPELIKKTLTTWQPYYKETLTEQDAVEMLLTVGNLYRVLLAGDSNEQLRSHQKEPEAA
jgi:TorA maturation chaperone TorD